MSCQAMCPLSDHLFERNFRSSDNHLFSQVLTKVPRLPSNPNQSENNFAIISKRSKC